MDDKVRIALRDLVTTQGEAVLSARERLRGLLSDDCPECSKEINVLMIAVQAQVPAELRTHPSATEPRIAVNSSIGRLQRAFSLDRSGSTWAVLSIAYALNRINEQQFHALIRELSLDSNITPPADRPTEPIRPVAPQPPPPPPPIARAASQASSFPPPRPISQPPYQPPPPRPTSQLPYQPPPVSPSYPQPYANQPTPVYSPAPQMPPTPGYPPQPVQPVRRGGSRAGIVIAICVGAVLLVGGGLYALAHHSSDTNTSQTRGGTQSGGTQSDGGHTSQTSDPPGANTPAQPQSDYLTYADTSGLFQVEVPRDWMFRRSESDTTLDNAACHLVRAALFPKDAEHADLNGWISAGVRISIYLPANGAVWQPEWAEDWQKRSFTGTLQGYTKFQNTNIEPVQLGNVTASTTAVMGEAPSIAEPEVARLYVGTNQKYLVVVDVAMPVSKRRLFEAADEKVRKTFELKVQ